MLFAGPYAGADWADFLHSGGAADRHNRGYSRREMNEASPVM